MNKQTDLALLLLRLWFGGEMLLKHGIPKLQKIINGDLGFPDPLGIGSTPSLYLATFAEVVCAFLLLIGFKTRWAAIPYAFTMLVAAYFHWGKGDEWSAIANPINYMVPALALYFTGAGRFSLDYQLTQRSR
ncbi:MAG: DoxX family protein [Bacteroidota bacterium]